jgi:hypothetical protein
VADETRVALAARGDEWRAGGGREDVAEDVARLLRVCFGPDVVERGPFRWAIRGVCIYRTRRGWSTKPDGRYPCWRGPLLSALCALAAAGVPVRGAEAAECGAAHRTHVCDLCRESPTCPDPDPSTPPATAGDGRPSRLSRRPWNPLEFAYIDTRTPPNAAGSGGEAETPCAACTPGLDGDCGTCPDGAGIRPGALVCDPTAPFYLLRVLGVRDGRILVCGFPGQDGLPDEGDGGEVSHWLTPRGDTWTDEDDRVFRLVPAEEAEPSAPTACPDCAALRARLEKSEAWWECAEGEIRDLRARLAEAEARCERLRAVVRAEAECDVERPDPDDVMWCEALDAVRVARAALQPGDVDIREGD